MQLFSETNPEQTRYRVLGGSIITLEGLIGVGKSSAGRALETYLKQIGLRAQFFTEYVCEPLLNQYISDMPKYAYHFQLIMLHKRFEIYHRAHEYAQTGGIAIVDRSLLGDYTFAKMQHEAGHITDLEIGVYLGILKEENLIEPSGIVYLDCSPQTAFDRMILRGNSGEKKGYRLEYFQDLAAAYQKSLAETSHEVLRIDWNAERSPDNVGGLAIPILEAIRTSLL